MVILEYVWLGGNNELRSKIRVWEANSYRLNDIPEWNYDGSSTGQAQGHDSEVVLRPCAIYKNPFFEN